MPFLIKFLKPLAAIALVLIIFSFGWYRGNTYQKAKFDAFVLQTEVNAKLQEQKVEQIQKAQVKVTENITRDYNNAIKKLNAYNSTKRVYNTQATSCKVPSKPNSTSATDGETQSDLSSTIRDCSLDVLQLLYLQQWIKDQELVNEN